MKFQLIEKISAIGRFWQTKPNNLISRWNLVLVVICLFGIVFNLDTLPPEIPLFASQPWGESQLAPTSYIFILPIFSFLIFILNNFLAVAVFTRHRLFSSLLLLFSLVFSLFSLITVFQIISLAT